MLQEGDVLCRLSGDEFLALMRGAPREQAVQRMNTALAALHGVQALSEQADAFSFGVLTPEPNGPARSVAQLLSDVDEKLHEKSGVSTSPTPSTRCCIPHSAAPAWTSPMIRFICWTLWCRVPTTMSTSAT
ncbi:MAG: diguanylate cyclase [Ruthenibacterium lactatiformans]